MLVNQKELHIDDFLSNNVNAFSGQVIVCDSYVPRLYSEILLSHSNGAPCFSFVPEACHIDQFGFKLTTILRLGRIVRLSVVTKDGSPHSLQIHLVAQEAALNVGFPAESLSFFVVEQGKLHSISHAAVRAARHLSEVESYVSAIHAAHDGREAASNQAEDADFHNFFIAVLLGGRSDLDRVNSSSMLDVLREAKVALDLTVISSEQNPEALRQYCQSLGQRTISVAICIAGGVPGLPAAVKAHLPACPVISVPLSGMGFDSREILLGSLTLPARRPVIIAGIDEIGLRKASYVALDIISAGRPLLQKKYQELLERLTPKPDFLISHE
jgi:phosphoribosylaminoimidazole carboxylase PurE protein